MPGLDKPRHLLLVEGGDEEHFVMAMQRLDENLPHFSVKRRRGVGDVLKNFTTQFKVDGREAVGIVTDANGDLISRWEEIIKQLPDDFGNIPSSPNHAGTILTRSNGQRFGIWLMPNNQSDGEFEYFIEQLIFDEDRIWDQAQHYVHNIHPEDQLFIERKRKKAEIRAWLAVREQPGLLGQAVQANNLNLDAPLARIFSAWLSNLFQSNESPANS